MEAFPSTQGDESEISILPTRPKLSMVRQSRSSNPCLRQELGRLAVHRAFENLQFAVPEEMSVCSRMTIVHVCLFESCRPR